ncbi:MAG: PKD domain-containing protein [Crocinitomicaceae bacterium]
MKSNKFNWVISMLLLLPTTCNAQDLHHQLESLFSNHSLNTFEQDLGLQAEDYKFINRIDYVNQSYDAFFESVHDRLSQGNSISPFDFQLEYAALLNSTQNAMKGMPNTPIPWTPKVPNGPCVNMDFETGDLTGWELTRGNVDGSAPYSYVNEFAVGPGPYHQVFGGGVDPITGIPCVNPVNGNFSVRLGNGAGVGARAARMRQTFLVDATNYMFTYSYAVIFESPAGHALNQLPYFVVRVYDENGVSAPCGDYSVIADFANAPNFQTIVVGGETVLYQDWQTVFANLSGYIGQNVTIEFTSGDCSLSGHYGYAYVDASCGTSELIASQNTICTGETTVLTAPPGAANYLWNTGETTQSIAVAAGGMYSCTLTPTQGGACSITLDITIDEYPTPTADFSSITEICAGESIVFTDLSSIPPPGSIVSYRWDFGDGIVTLESTGAIVGVPQTNGTYQLANHIFANPGVYDVELWVQSADGCEDSITIPVTVNPLPLVDAGADQEVCEGSAVTLNGNGAVNYVWDNGVTDGIPFVQAIGTVTYTVVGTDNNGCSNSDQVDVTVNPLPIVEAGLDQTVCDGAATTLSGAGAVNYAWDNGVIDGVAFAQAVGTVTYTVIGTDANNCENSDQVNVTVNPLPVVNAGPDQEVCDGFAVTLTGAGATSYAWDNGVIDGIAFNPPIGITTYSVIGTDPNGCTNNDQVDVTVNSLPIVNAGPDQEVCEGTAVTLNGVGATSYDWDNGVIDGIPFVQSVGTITYTVIGTDANSCENSDQVNVTVNPNPTVDAGIDQTVCDGTPITLFAAGTPNLNWNNGVINNVPFNQGVGTVVYTVFDSFATGCSASDQVSITVNPNPIVTAEDVEICEGEGVTLFGQGAVAYSWSDGIIDGIEFFPTQTATFTVTGTNVFGCSSTADATVTVFPAPIADFNVLDLHLTMVTPGTGFDNLSSGAITYEWNFGDGSGISNEFEPYHEFPTSEPGSYEIILTAFSPDGCIAEHIKYVYVTQDYTIYVPNTFTPDGNGVNETFKPVLEGFDEDDYTLYIFNRWGELVFESHDMNVGWDGKYSRLKEEVQDGVFTWKIEAGIKYSSDSKIFVGHVSILK